MKKLGNRPSVHNNSSLKGVLSTSSAVKSLQKYIHLMHRLVYFQFSKDEYLSHRVIIFEILLNGTQF